MAGFNGPSILGNATAVLGLPLTFPGGGGPIPTTFFILSEAGDFCISEASDSMVQEIAP
jgi:hypothetical protein|tara:strand:+ start:186 stop:362 length:177 start_codon:yes stop_codon:yes gene_type:complete